MHMMAKHPNNAADILVGSVKANQRVRDLLDTEPLFTARQNPATMYGWRMALRHMIDALDGEGAWMKYPQLMEDGEQA